MISGTVENAQEGQKVIVSELNDSNTQAVPLDTVVVKDGKFELDLPEKESPTISFLTLEGARGNVVYIADNTPLISTFILTVFMLQQLPEEKIMRSFILPWNDS